MLVVGRKAMVVSAIWSHYEFNCFLQLRVIRAVFTLIQRDFTPSANETVDEKSVFPSSIEKH